MRIARQKRHGCTVGCATFGCFPLVLGTVAIAIHNLIHHEAMIASVLWLAMVGFGIWASLDATTPRQLLINTLGGFSYRQFVEIATTDRGDSSVHFGYELFGKSFYQLRIPAEDIWWVNWRTGQASYHAGHDVDDWHVMIWYRDDKAYHRGRSLHTIGFQGPKESIEAFGIRFVDFLKAGGIDLVWDEKESEFATPNAPSREADRES